MRDILITGPRTPEEEQLAAAYIEEMKKEVRNLPRFREKSRPSEPAVIPVYKRCMFDLRNRLYYR
jgi:hypothetical protein